MAQHSLFGAFHDFLVTLAGNEYHSKGTMPNNKQVLDKQITQIDDYHKMEIQEIFTSIRTVNTLRIQIYSFFGTANVTILGLAVRDKNTGLILLAASLLVVLVLVDRQLRIYFSGLISRGRQLEALYAPDKESAFMHKYATQSSYSKDSMIQRYWLALFVLIVEIAMAILSTSFLNWSLF